MYLGYGWEITGVSLYKDTVYYCGYDRGSDGHMYRLKLGKDQSPEYMGTGSIYGIYDSVLLGGIDGKYCLMDLSKKEPEWISLSLKMSETPKVHYKDQLWLFDGVNGQYHVKVIDLKKRTGKTVEIECLPKETVLDGEMLYYTVSQGGIGKERILFRADLRTKKAEEIYRLSEDQDWEYAGGRILIYKNFENPQVIDLKTKETFVPKDFTPYLLEKQKHIMYTVLGDGTVMIEYYDKTKQKLCYWCYDIAENRGEDFETRDECDTRRFTAGGYYYYADTDPITFYLGEKEYQFDAESIKYGVDAVNEYGAAVGTKGWIYTVRWSEGNAYTAFSTEKHPVVLE